MTNKPPPTAPKAKTAGNLSVETLRLGRIKATIWENEADNRNRPA